MEEALKFFCKGSTTLYLFDKILGCFKGNDPLMKISLPNNFTAPNLPLLNSY